MSDTAIGLMIAAAYVAAYIALTLAGLWLG